MSKPLIDLELTLDNLPDVARQLLASTNEKIFLFNAQMGGGKTTVIKELCKHLGSTDNLSSPTYSIVNEYSYPGGKIFHFDLYRVKSVAELLDAGAEEYLDSGHYCFIEWPVLAEELVEADFIKVNIEMNGETRRLIAWHIRN
jgi:tRNA threonylcarbamoyladenosine biosynthesis protein TsaE